MSLLLLIVLLLVVFGGLPNWATTTMAMHRPGSAASSWSSCSSCFWTGGWTC